MKKLIASVLFIGFVGMFVTTASPREKSGPLKYEQSEKVQLPAVQGRHFDVCILHDNLSILPDFTTVAISYYFVEPTLMPSQAVISRCNSPPEK